MDFKKYKNIGIIGKRFSGKTTFIDHLLNEMSPKRYFYFTTPNETKNNSLIFEIYNLKEVLEKYDTEKIIVLDDVIYRKEILRFNKKTWEKFFTQKNNKSILSSCNPSCLLNEPFDVIFLKTSKNIDIDNVYLYENYAKDLCSIEKFMKVIKNDTVVIDYISDDVYPYFIDEDRYRKLFDDFN